MSHVDRRSLRAVCYQAALAGLLVACGDRNAPPLAATPLDAGVDAPSDGADAVADAQGADAQATDAEAPCDGIRVRHLAGQVLDVHGNPPGSLLYTVCGSACVRGELNADGSFVFDKNWCYSPVGPLPRPVFIYHGLHADSDLYVDFVMPAERDVSFTFAAPLHVVPLAEMAVVPVDPDAGTTLTLADGKGFELTFAASSVDLGFSDSVAVGVVPNNVYPPIPGTDQLLALYAMHPSEVVFTVPAAVTFPNVTKLAPGSPVEIMIIGSAPGANGPYPGTLDKVATGKVSEDGARIVSDPGQGLSSVSWVGYRPAP